MALYHKLGVKTGFTFALQFFKLIFDGLGGVFRLILMDLDSNIGWKFSFLVAKSLTISEKV